jgi:cold shock CspA family protein
MSSTTERRVGQVKWFNNKAGYGFITITENGVQKDIFTHYSTIQVANSQYKYLIQGEYVEFDLVDSTNDSHEIQAVNVTGINRGPLMCETRKVNQSGKEDPVGSTTRPARKPTTRKPRSQSATTTADAATETKDEASDKPEDQPEGEFKTVVSKKDRQSAKSK